MRNRQAGWQDRQAGWRDRQLGADRQAGGTDSRGVMLQRGAYCSLTKLCHEQTENHHWGRIHLKARELAAYGKTALSFFRSVYVS